jgi:hypothetical protein
MKHLVLFEAFNSDILGKTLRFIDKQSRLTFKYWLIEIGRILDFPISEFSDDLFEYLPYNKALKKQPTDHKETIIPCDYESQWIPGEFCNEGRVKRTWGNHKRTVKCPKCDGKGTLSYQEEDNRVPRFIKFWFNKDGEFTLASGTNGYKSENFEFSRDKSDYKEVTKRLKAKDIRKLPTGSILWVKPNYSYVVCFVLQTGDRTFLLQDSDDGEWINQTYYLGKDIADYSWIVNGDYDINSTATLLEPLDKEGKDDYSYEKHFNLNYRDKKIDLKSPVKKENIQLSDFAIVLDFDKLIKKDYQRVSKTKEEREEQKKGALALKSDEEIKKLNIDRYTSELIKRFNLDGTTKISSVFKRGLGLNNSLFFIVGDVNIDQLNYLVSDIRDFFEDEDEYQMERIKNRIKSIYDDTSNTNKNIKEREEIAKPRFIEDDDKRKFEIYNKIKELSQLTYQALNRYSTDTITDVYIYFDKITSIQSLFNRFSHLKECEKFIRYQVNGSYNPHEDITDEILSSYYDRILKEAEEFKKVLEKI